MAVADLERWVNESHWKVVDQAGALEPSAGSAPPATVPRKSPDSQPVQLLKGSRGPLFSFLPPSDLEELARLSRVRSFNPGEKDHLSPGGGRFYALLDR